MDVAAEMAEAAHAWLDTLGPEQRAIAQHTGPVGADDDRVRWFYTPTDHGGLTGHAQRPAQQRRAMHLLATGLSPAAYGTVATIMGLENVLDRNEGFTAWFGRERGRDPGLYYLRVFGVPGEHGVWGWRFGGHHVSVNILVIDGLVAATTPSFLGADPARSPLLGGAELRPHAAAEDLGLELVRSLSPELARAAILLPRAPSDIVTGNRTRVAPGDRMISLAGVWGPMPAEAAPQIQRASDAIDTALGLPASDHDTLALRAEPSGVAASELDATQRELLRALLDTYLGRVPSEISPASRYADSAALDAVHFAWAGPTEPGGPVYYRVQGPRLLLEYDNTQRAANHAHAVWRDPENDFGFDVLAQHLRADHTNL